VVLVNAAEPIPNLSFLDLSKTKLYQPGHPHSAALAKQPG